MAPTFYTNHISLSILIFPTLVESDTTPHSITIDQISLLLAQDQVTHIILTIIWATLPNQLELQLDHQLKAVVISIWIIYSVLLALLLDSL